jgi:hypothetical protein
MTVVLEGGSDTDAAELARLTGQLRGQLLELDVETVELARGEEIPEGAKPLDPVTIGALVVTVGPAALEAAVALVDRWLSHRPVRSAKLTIAGDTIELTEATAADQQRLVDAFIARHATPPGP